MSQNLPGLPSMSSDDDEEPTVVPTPATPGPSRSQTPATPSTSKKRALEGTDVTGTQKKRARRSGITKRNVLTCLQLLSQLGSHPAREHPEGQLFQIQKMMIDD